MTEITLNTGGMPVRTIEQITASVRMNTQAAGMHILQIGQDMIDAKALLSHGQWLPWLESVGYSARTAENWMRIAREVSPDSALSGLPQAKVLALLALPAEEREQFAQENAVEEKSAAEIRRLIKEKEGLAQEVKARDVKIDELIGTLEAVERREHEARHQLTTPHTVTVEPDDYQELKRKAQRYDQDLADAAQAAVEAEERARALARELERAQASTEATDPVRELESVCNDFLITANLLPYQPGLICGLDKQSRCRMVVNRLREWCEEMTASLDGAGPVLTEGAVS